MKDPAFLFYPGDWMQGTHWMTFEQKGCYLELLLLQFNTGQFTEAQAKQVLSICFDVAWPMLKQKFKQEGIYFFNERLRIEIEKRKKFTESRRINGLSPKNNNKEIEASAKHMHKHMGNRNKNRNSNLNISEFVSNDFIEIVDKWLEYKRERKENYKSEKSVKAFYNELLKLSSSNPELALQIINKSFANNWAGIFPLNKVSKNGNNNSKTKTGSFEYQPN